MRLLSLLLALQAPSQSARSPAPDTAHIVIVATTDIHGRVLGWDYVRDAATPGGLSRAATAMETLRARYPSNLILVDAGDLLQGNPFAAFYGRYDKRQPQPIVDARREQLSAGMQVLNGVHAQTFNGRYRRWGHLFGERFWSQAIVTEEQLVSTCAYVVNNPVRAGLCAEPEDWPWSGLEPRLREYERTEHHADHTVDREEGGIHP